MSVFDWNPPVQFHFMVIFEGIPGSVSFAEVDGLDQELTLDDQMLQGSNVIGLPNKVKFGDIVLKRALEPLSDMMNLWVQSSFTFMITGKVFPKSMTILLLDEKSVPVAGWLCYRALPIKWKLGTLKASESGILLESMTLRHSFMMRIL